MKIEIMFERFSCIFLFKHWIKQKQKLDSLLFYEENNSKAIKSYQVIRPECPPLSQ